MSHLLSRGRPVRTLAALLLLGLTAVLARPAAAQTTVYTFGGSYSPDFSYNDGFAYDGTNVTDLPPVLDLTRLDGGTFTATYTTPANPTPDLLFSNQSEYFLDSGSTIQFTLFDASGNVVYQSSGAAAFNEGDVYHGLNVGTGLVDQFVRYSIDGEPGVPGGYQIFGLTPPVTAYGPADFYPLAQFNFSDYSDPYHDPAHPYLPDLSLPTDPAALLAFPERQFNFDASFADGDYLNGVGPFEFFDTNAVYTVTSATITTVPEPSPAAALGLGLLILAARLARDREARRKKETRIDA